MKYVLLFLFYLFLKGCVMGQDTLNFYTSFGAENHSSSADYGLISAIYSLENNQLVFRIEVQDDDAIFNGSWLKSDHLEFWFSTHERTKKLYKIDHELSRDVWFGYVPGEDGPKKAKTIGERDSSIREDYNLHLGVLHYSSPPMDSGLYDARLFQRNNFVGVTHWGIYPDTALIYDLEQYVNFPIKFPTHRPEICFQQTAKGYQYEVRFSVENLLFADRASLNSLRCNVVLYDQDREGRSLHTTSRNYSWGKVDDFITLEFDEPLNIGLDASYTDYEGFESKWHRSYYYYDNERWQRYFTDCETGDWWDNVCEEEHAISPVLRNEQQIGGRLVYQYRKPLGLLYVPSTAGDSQRYYFRNQKQSWEDYEHPVDWQADDTLKTYAFNDGSFGIWTYTAGTRSPWGRGPCGACLIHDYAFVRIDSSSVSSIYSFTVDEGSFGAHSDLWPIFSSLQWDSQNNRLSMDWSAEDGGTDTTIHIGWDANWNSYEIPLDSL